MIKVIACKRQLNITVFFYDYVCIIFGRATLNVII